MNNINLKDFKQFFVGLVDGDGSIQTNKSEVKSRPNTKGNFRHRIIIRLKHFIENENLLKLIESQIGGKFAYDTKVYWAAE